MELRFKNLHQFIGNIKYNNDSGRSSIARHNIHAVFGFFTITLKQEINSVHS